MNKFILTKKDLVNSSYTFLLNDLAVGESKEIPFCNSDNGLLFYNWCKNKGIKDGQVIWVKNTNE